MKKTIIILILTITMYQLNSQEIHKVKSGNAELEVTVYPKENAETIIFLHGGPSAPAKFTKEISYVKDQYQVINFNQRDAGRSTCQKCDYTLEEYITDIKSIMTHFKIEKVHLYGHSWGGAYAQIFMEAHPELVKSVFLSSPSSGIGEQWKEMQKEVMMYNKRKSTKKEWRRMGMNAILGSMGSKKAMGRLYVQVIKNYNRGFIEIDESKITPKNYDKAGGKSTHKLLKNLKQSEELKGLSNPDFPILITWGDDDIYGNTTQHVIDRYPTAKVEFIPNCGHLPTSHNPEFYYNLFKEFYNL